MVASLLRLLHSGPQDERIRSSSTTKGNPDTTAFTWVLQKVGRFTKQWHRLDFAQPPDFGTTATCRIPVKGELLSRLILVVNLPDIASVQKSAEVAAGSTNFAGPSFGWTNSLGHALIQTTICEIGGNRIEQLDGRLMEVIDEFNTPLEKVLVVNDMIGRIQNGFNEKSLGNDSTVPPTRVAIPIPFWFNRGDTGAVLPVDALNVDPVTIRVQFRPVQSLIVSDSYIPETNVADSSVEGSYWFPIQASKFYKYDASGSVVPGIGNGQPVSIIENIQMPNNLSLGDCYFMAEYIYLDRPEANRFRINDLYYTISNHNAISPFDTFSFRRAQIPMEISNPVRHIYFYANRYEAAGYNAFFLATRDLSGVGTSVPWWPDCKGLTYTRPETLQPGFLKRYSEPFAAIELVYEGEYTRYSTENCALFRSILPSLEEKKSPWHNRFFYTIGFGLQNGFFPASMPLGNANFGRLQKKELRLTLNPFPESATVVKENKYPRYIIYCWVETMNILKIFGGRGTLLFGY